MEESEIQFIRQTIISRNDIIKNEKGLVTLTYLSVLPVIISFFLFFYVFTSIFKGKNSTQKYCRKILYHQQSQQTKYLIQLLKLNPKALHLRLRKRILQAKLIAALSTGNVFAVANIEAQLLKLKQRQINLAKKQNLILWKSKSQNRLTTHTLYQELRSFSAFNISTNLPELKLLKVPLHSLSPSYFTKTNFSNLQLSTARWDLSFNFENWIAIFLRQPLKKISLSCASTITKRRFMWSPTLKKAK